jgi:hypothetical protein
VIYNELPENHIDHRIRFTIQVSFFNPENDIYPQSYFDITKTLSGPGKIDTRQKLAQLVLDQTSLYKPTKEHLAEICTKKKSSAMIRAKFLRTFYFILSTEFTLANRLPFIWNSRGFKAIISALGLRTQVENLFLEWFKSETFVSIHWVRFDGVEKEFFLKSKSEFCEERNQKFEPIRFSDLEIQEKYLNFYEKSIDNDIDIKLLFEGLDERIDNIRYYPFNEVEWTIVDIIGRRVNRRKQQVKYKVIWGVVNGEKFVG